MITNINAKIIFQEWQPPFAVDVDNFRFTPRMQRLNELEVFSLLIYFDTFIINNYFLKT